MPAWIVAVSWYCRYSRGIPYSDMLYIHRAVLHDAVLGVCSGATGPPWLRGCRHPSVPTRRAFETTSKREQTSYLRSVKAGPRCLDAPHPGQDLRKPAQLSSGWSGNIDESIDRLPYLASGLEHYIIKLVLPVPCLQLVIVACPQAPDLCLKRPAPVLWYPPSTPYLSLSTSTSLITI